MHRWSWLEEAQLGFSWLGCLRLPAGKRSPKKGDLRFASDFFKHVIVLLFVFLLVHLCVLFVVLFFCFFSLFHGAGFCTKSFCLTKGGIIYFSLQAVGGFFSLRNFVCFLLGHPFSYSRLG